MGEQPGQRAACAGRASALAVLCLSAGLQAGAASEAPVVARDVAVRMRDGVTLRADVLRPEGRGPFPALVYRTPYGKHGREHPIFAKAVARGYAVVIQDVRGRYASEGEFEPYRNEGRDGYDTIEWAAAQPWSSGSVGTFGLSYPGAVQWLAAVEHPPHLLAMVPAMTFSTPRNFFYSGGAFDMSWISWIWHNVAPDVRARKRLAGPATQQEAASAWPGVRDAFMKRTPLRTLGELAEVAPFYFQWLAHPPADRYWDYAELRGRYEGVSAAVLNLSGWHDETYGPEGAITNYRGLRRAREGSPEPRARLILGPWTHGAGSTERTEAGERDFGPAARIDYAETVLGFLDHYVRGGDEPLAREKPVRAFVMGENAWREADGWPFPGTERRSLYLTGGEGRRGTLAREPHSRGPESSTWVADPAKPVFDPRWESPGAHDYRALAERDDVLVFETAPLEREWVVLGEIEAEIAVSSDAPDLDLWVKLFDVAPGGTAFNLMSPGLDVLRASYRNGFDRRQPLVAGRVETFRLENLRTGNAFRAGHRIRVVLAGSFFPYFSRNPQTGLSETDSAEMRPAKITVHHSQERRSRLVLPILPR